MRAAYVFRQPGGHEWAEVGSQGSITDPKPHFVTSGSGERKARASDHSGGLSPAYLGTTSIVRNFEVTAEK